jgi:ATP-binding cassette subfamily B protein
VPQEGRLFSGSLRDNLLYARPDGDEQHLAEVARRVALAGEIAHFPQGVETRVGEGGLALSGGQRQRVCLGRALARGGNLWLLDDPLSNLDAATARAVWAELLPALRGATVLVATGRVSLLAACDQVVLLDGGGMVATGSHEELLATSALYRQLAERERIEDELEVLA